MKDDANIKLFILSIYSALILEKHNFSDDQKTHHPTDFSFFDDLSPQEIDLIKKANVRHLKKLTQLQNSLKSVANMVNEVLEVLPLAQSLNCEGTSAVELPAEEEPVPAVAEEVLPSETEKKEVVEVVEARPPTPSSAEEKKEAVVCDYAHNHENDWKLEFCAKLYEKLTIHQTNSFALMRALTTMDFDDFRRHFKSQNLFHVWLNVILRTEVLYTPGVWLKKFMQNSAKLTRMCWDTLRKCMNVHVLRCCVDIGVELNIDQRNKAAKLGILV